MKAFKFRFSRQAAFLSLGLFILGLGLNLTWQFLPIYFEGIVENAFLVGLLLSLPSLVNLFLDIPAGNYIQRSGERIVFGSGLLVYSLPPLLFFIGTPIALFAGKMVEGGAKSLLWTSGWSLTLKSSEDGSDSESASIFLLGEMIASIAGPIAGGLLITWYGFQPLFVAWFLLGLLASAVFLWRSKASIGDLENPSFLFARKTYRNDFKSLKHNWRGLKGVFALVLLHSVLFSFYWYAVPLTLDEFDASFVEMGLVFGVAMVPALFQFGFGYLSDKIGHRRSILALSIPLIIVLVAMSLAESILVLSALYFIAALLTFGIDPGIHALFDLNVPDEKEGELTGFFETFKHTGQFIGPLSAGAIASAFSLSATFLFAAIAAGLIAAAALKIEA